MTQAKYFQKLKCDECENISGRPAIHTGADITEIIKPILEGIDKEIKLCDEAIKYYATNYHFVRKPKLQELGHQAVGLQKAKQIIEENVIKVED